MRNSNKASVGGVEKKRRRILREGREVTEARSCKVPWTTGKSLNFILSIMGIQWRV